MLLEGENQTVYRGEEGSARFLKELLNRKSYGKVLIVRGANSFVSCGAENFLSPVLKEHQQVSISFSGSILDKNELWRGLKCCESFKPDCVIGVGGGSVMDMAKLIAFFSASGINPDDWLNETFDHEKFKALPLVLIPTTAGSGSEATPFAVLYNKVKKYSVSHSAMLADTVLLNPRLTDSLSRYQTACSGYDALAQSVESFMAVGATETSRGYSARALKLGMTHFERAVFFPQPENRDGMLEASYRAGKAIGIAKTTAAHALSYTLTAVYGVPHGHAVALLLPSVLEFNAEVQESDCNDPRGVHHVKQTIHELCSLLGFASVKETVRFLDQLPPKEGLPPDCFQNKWVSQPEFKQQILNGVNFERMLNNPRKMNEEAICQIADRIFSGNEFSHG